MNKVNKILFTTILLIFSISNIIFAGRWVQVGDNWRYERHNGGGDYIMERWWEDINANKVYYFDFYGNMVSGPIVINSKLYIYADTGEAITTGFDIDGVHYETSGKGEVLGLPQNFDLSAYPVAVTDSMMKLQNITANNQKNVYDDNSNAAPVAKQDGNTNIYDS